MDGLIVSLFKEPITTNYSKPDQHSQSTEDTADYTVWMHYDFIKIDITNEFEKYFLSNADEAITDDRHEGDRQSMHLYFFEREEFKEPILKVYSEPKGKIFYCSEKVYNFACITTIKLNQAVKAVTKVEESVLPNRFHANLIKITEVFDQAIAKYENDFVYDWYGSLGTEELVLIINADSIKVFTDIIEIIRMEKSTNQYLSSTYSFTFSNYHQISEQAANAKLDLDANISLTLNPSGNFIEYMNSITQKIYSDLQPDGKLSEISEIESYLSENYKIKFFNMIGKYDYYISIPKETWNFLGEFNKGGLFNSDTKEYQKNVFQIKTNWMYSDRELSKYYNAEFETRPEVQHNKNIDEYIANIGKQIDDLKNNLPESLKRAQHILRAIDLLYYDFKKNIRSIFAAEWSEDLYYQFKTFLNLLKNFNEDIEVQFSIIEESINSLRQTYIHITQASRMFFEIPATNLRYTGSFNKILRAYYGIVKQLLYIAYSVQRCSTQSMLVPIITFEYTTKVNTHIYSQTKELGADRLVVFHLPYEALVNIPKYTRYLCHEVFHYIAPYSRYERNKLLSDISIFYYYHNFLSNILMEYVSRKHEELSNELVKTLTGKYLELNADIIKNVIEELYRNFRVVNDEDSFDVNDWFEKQSLKFFIESLEKSFFSPADRCLARCRSNSEDFLEDWINKARNFTPEEAEAVCTRLSQETQLQPGLNRDSILEIFDLRKNKEDLHSKMDQMNKEYLSLKYKQDFITRCEFIAYGMKEAKCDYFTIQIMQFDLEKFLNFQFEFLYEHGVLTNISREDPEIIESSFMVRIGIICEYYRNHRQAGTPDQFEASIKNCTLTEDMDNEQKKDSFKHFLDYIVYSYRQYRFAYSYYSDEILQNFLAETIKADKICNECLKNTRLAKNEIYIYCSSYGTQDPGIKFKTNIDMMERFQEQLSMQTLEETSKKPTLESQKPAVILGKKTPSEENYGYIASISSLSEYLQEIKVVNTFLKPKNQKNSREANLLWYRGQTNRTHILLPGLMRKWKKGSNISPLEKEIAFMDIFSSRTMHTMESDMHLLQNTFDWLVQMQHYSIPTNLLDWSENAFVALFFALIKKDDSITETDAAVYILNPEYMELARETLVKQTELKSLQRRMYPIANFSKNCYDENNEEFIPIGIKQPVYTRASGWWSDDTGKSDNWWPKPIISSLSNIRIRAQYGAFTIFNLMAKPRFDKTSEDHGYNYLSIENMQQEFLKRYPTENPFLYKINIKKDFVNDIAKELKCAGYRIMNVYPELENISNAIVKQVDAYFKG